MNGFWTYRIMRKQHENGDITYGIYEVYGKNNKIDYHGWTEDAIGHEYENLDEIAEDLAWQVEATKKDILDYETGKKIDGV